MRKLSHTISPILLPIFLAFALAHLVVDVVVDVDLAIKSFCSRIRCVANSIFPIQMIYLPGFIPQTNRLFTLIVFLFTMFYVGEKWRKNSIEHSYYAVVCMTFKYISSFLHSYGFLGSNRIIALFVRHLRRRQQITEWVRDSSQKLICRQIFSEIENNFFTFKKSHLSHCRFTGNFYFTLKMPNRWNRGDFIALWLFWWLVLLAVVRIKFNTFVAFRLTSFLSSNLNICKITP